MPSGVQCVFFIHTLGRTVGSLLSTMLQFDDVNNNNLIISIIMTQGDHQPGKSRIVREFDGGQGKLGKVESRGKCVLFLVCYRYCQGHSAVT